MQRSPLATRGSNRITIGLLARRTADAGLERDTDMNMTRAIAVVACSLGLAACSSWATSWMPSFELLSSKPATATLTIESDPPGADASISTGASCRTPCSLAVPLADALVSYELTGYLPQTVPVRPLSGESTATQFDPNPVFVDVGVEIAAFPRAIGSR